MVVLGLCQKWKFTNESKKRKWESIKLMYSEVSHVLCFTTLLHQHRLSLLFIKLLLARMGCGVVKKIEIFSERLSSNIINNSIHLNSEELTYVSPKQLKIVLEVIYDLENFFFF